jgi:ATP-binding cassette, subfamily F, member 3
LRIIAGTEPIEGERKWGHNVDESFYAQHQLEALNVNNTILDEMKEAGAKKTELELRSLLGCFLFSGDDADKKIKILSGGEKARVALAKTITSKANFLLLDEPTNHLDIHSNELLIDALNRYEGSFMLVSHDRYFIAKTANKIWEIDNHKIREFKGGYEEYVLWKERKEKELREQGTRDKEQGTREKEQGTMEKAQGTRDKEQGIRNKAQDSSEKIQNTPINKEAQKELQKIQKQFQQLEKQVNDLTDKKAKLEMELASSEIYSNADAFKKTETAYKDVIAQLQKATNQYEEVFEKIMSLEQ